MSAPPLIPREDAERFNQDLMQLLEKYSGVRCDFVFIACLYDGRRFMAGIMGDRAVAKGDVHDLGDRIQRHLKQEI